LAALGAAFSVEEWTLKLVDVILGSKGGKAVGPDQIPGELLRAAGLGAARHLAQILLASLRDGLPLAFRGARMAPVKRKPGPPMSYSNSRGVACSNASAKAVGRALRAEVLPPVAAALDGWQFGAVAGGGTDFPSHAIRTFMAYGHVTARTRCSSLTCAQHFTEPGQRSRWVRRCRPASAAAFSRTLDCPPRSPHS